MSIIYVYIYVVLLFYIACLLYYMVVCCILYVICLQQGRTAMSIAGRLKIINQLINFNQNRMLALFWDVTM